MAVVDKLAAFGLFGALAALAMLLLYMAARWVQRQLFIRSLRMSRITVNELCRLMVEQKQILILDVRPLDARVAGGIIPGAVAAHATEIKAVLQVYTHDHEMIVYCACPNEASAASAAKHLRRAGFKNIRAFGRHRCLGAGRAPARTLSTQQRVHAINRTCWQPRVPARRGPPWCAFAGERRPGLAERL
jgi:rhodanese-related sulfurtransferase